MRIHHTVKSLKANQWYIGENKALKQFQNTTKQNEENRYVMQLPVKTELSNLGQSIHLATSRFLNVERKLQKNADLRVEYTRFIKEGSLFGNGPHV